MRGGASGGSLLERAEGMLGGFLGGKKAA
jgi:hypothetical protein